MFDTKHSFTVRLFARGRRGDKFISAFTLASVGDAPWQAFRQMTSFSQHLISVCHASDEPARWSRRCGGCVARRRACGPSSAFRTD